MKVINLGADRWRRFTMPDTNLSVEFALPRTSEFDELARIGNDGKRRRDFVAKNWMRGMVLEGCDVADTFENRCLLLDEPDVSAWVWSTVSAFEKWREEGNAGSGSAS